MYSLILDSGNTYLNVGLAKDSKILQKISYECWQRQSEMMIPEIDNILKNNSVNPKDIGEIIVTIGPGSYTGVRIALTIAKIYAFSLNIPCYALSSLKVLGSLNKTSICLINARSKRSYFAVYENNNCLIKDTIFTNEEVLKYIEEHKDFEVCGDTKYLGIEGKENDVLEAMLSLKSNEDLVKDIVSLKAVYLKD